MKFIKSHGGREQYFPIKYKKDRTNDCVIRSIAIATGISYLEVRDDLFEIAKTQGRMPNDKAVYEYYLEILGWVKKSPMKKHNGKRFKLWEIEIDTAIFKTSGHLCAIKNGDLHDTWDCRKWAAQSYYIKEEN